MESLRFLAALAVCEDKLGMLSAPSRKATLRDVAAKAGVSIATASRYLREGEGSDKHVNAVGSAKAATRARVQAAAHALGYRSNPLLGEVMRAVRRRAANRHLGTLAHLVEPEFWERGSASRLGRYGPAVKVHAARYNFGVETFPLGVPEFSPAKLAKILTARGIDGVVLEVFPNKAFVEEFPWARFSSVLVGHGLRSPGLDCVVSDHSRGVRLAGAKLLERAYQRIGLALETRHVADTHGAWVDGFHLLQQRHAHLRDIPPLIEAQMTKRAFLTWLRDHRIDAVLTISIMQNLHNPMRHWLAEAGIDCPGEVAIATLDRSFVPLPWAGLDQSSDEISAAGVDLCMTKLRLGERGIPAIPRTILLHSYWCEGLTARRAVS